MGKTIKFTEEQTKEIIRFYVEEKLGTPSIGKKYNVHKQVINRILKENNIQLDQSGRRNIGGRKIAQQRYESKNKNKRSNYHKKWYEKNKENRKEYHKEWRTNNEEYTKRRAEYELNKLNTDPIYRLRSRTRTAVYTCLKERNIAKYRSTFETLGYTLEQLINHLESQFTEGMIWDNYGEWHVDHKIPMVKFNFTSIDDHEFKLCWSLENLKPMWATTREINGVVYEGNLNKGAK